MARDRVEKKEEPAPPGGDPEAEGQTLDGEEGGFLPDFLRRGLTLGFTGFFMTEEALRRALGDSVPRDWIEFFVEQSDRTRAEFLDRMSSEFGRVLNALDPVEVLRRLLDGQTIEVSAKLRLSSRDDSDEKRSRVKVTPEKGKESE